jgi:hypothetical protein
MFEAQRTSGRSRVAFRPKRRSVANIHENQPAKRPVIFSLRQVAAQRAHRDVGQHATPAEAQLSRRQNVRGHPTGDHVS